MLLGLGALTQLGPGAAPLKQHRRSVGFAVRSFSGSRRRQMLERIHPDRLLSAERGQPLSLVQRLGMVPSHLEHDFVSVTVGARSHPRAVASGLERLVEVQLPALCQFLDSFR